LIGKTILYRQAWEFVIEGNTIKKAYISHSPVKHLKPGDIVLFYRSKDIKSLTSLGVIEEIRMGLTDPNEIIRFVGRRTVYSPTEIESSPKPLTVVLFRHHFHLKNPLKSSALIQSGVLLRAPQSIMHISDENYNVIKNLGGIDGRFTIH
jgi:hypothetical protein